MIGRRACFSFFAILLIGILMPWYLSVSIFFILLIRVVCVCVCVCENVYGYVYGMYVPWRCLLQTCQQYVESILIEFKTPSLIFILQIIRFGGRLNVHTVFTLCFLFNFSILRFLRVFFFNQPFCISITCTQFSVFQRLNSAQCTVYIQANILFYSFITYPKTNGS